MSDLIPEMKSTNEQAITVKRFQELVSQGAIKSFVIAAVDVEGRSIVIQEIESIIEGFGILKTAEIALSSMAMGDEDYDD